MAMMPVVFTLEEDFGLLQNLWQILYSTAFRRKGHSLHQLPAVLGDLEFTVASYLGNCPSFEGHLLHIPSLCVLHSMVGPCRKDSKA